jgi:hypothetical protein
MTGDNFVLDTQHFIKHTRVTKDEPVLILLDTHQSRLDIKFLDLVEENGVEYHFHLIPLSKCNPQTAQFMDLLKSL